MHRAATWHAARVTRMRGYIGRGPELDHRWLVSSAYAGISGRIIGSASWSICVTRARGDFRREALFAQYQRDCHPHVRGFPSPE